MSQASGGGVGGRTRSPGGPASDSRPRSRGEGASLSPLLPSAASTDPQRQSLSDPKSLVGFPRALSARGSSAPGPWPGTHRPSAGPASDTPPPPRARAPAPYPLRDRGQRQPASRGRRAAPNRPGEPRENRGGSEKSSPARGARSPPRRLAGPPQRARPAPPDRAPRTAAAWRGRRRPREGGRGAGGRAAPRPCARSPRAGARARAQRGQQGVKPARSPPRARPGPAAARPPAPLSFPPRAPAPRPRQVRGRPEGWVARAARAARPASRAERTEAPARRAGRTGPPLSRAAPAQVWCARAPGGRWEDKGVGGLAGPGGPGCGPGSAAAVGHG